MQAPAFDSGRMVADRAVRPVPTRLVLIAEGDSAVPSARDAGNDFRLRSMSASYVARVSEVFSQAGFVIVHYTHPRQLIEHASEHLHDVVLSLWHGSGSRNQVALVPAICEAYGIAFVGADAHARAICEDKFHARCLAMDLGFSVPEGVIVRSPAEAVLLDLPAPPVVLKPVWGGMSRGVELYARDAPCGPLRAAVNESLSALKQPILVERFCSGQEIMIVLLGRSGRLALYEACEVFCRVDETYFQTRIFDAELKQTMSRRDWGLRRVTDVLGPDIRSACERCFEALAPLHYVRIDGRWDGERFWFLELTPTPNFHSLSALAEAARWNGLESSDVAHILVDLAKERPVGCTIERA